MTRHLAWATLALSGCPSVPEAEGPCPCAAPLVCCATVDRCLPADARCLGDTAEAAPIVSITPAVGRAAQVVEVQVEPPAPIAAVRIGPALCVPVDADAARCRVPPNPGGHPTVDVQIDLQTGAPLVLAGGFRYRLPAFTEVSAAVGVVSGAGAGVAQIDLDGDGDRDLVFAVADADAAAVFRQVDAWRFEPEAGLAPLQGLRVEDLDQDGHLDLLALHDAGDHVDGAPWSRQLADQIRPASAAEFALNETVNGVLVDLDADGWADWVGHRQSVALDRPGWTRSLFVAPGGPDGFDVQPAPFAPDSPFGTGAVRRYALIDHDSDGDADVLVCGDALWLFANEGGVLVDRTARLGDAIALPCGDIAVADFDADGAPDIAWVPALDFAQTLIAEAHSGVWILRNPGPDPSASFSVNSPQPAENDPPCTVRQAAGSTLALGRSVIAAFDVDLDGDEDLFLPTPMSLCPGPMAWYENAGGRFVAHAIIGPQPGVQPAAALPVDLDGDGDLDVVTAGSGPGERGRVWRNLIIEDGAAAQGLTVALDAPQTARGARVTLTAGGVTQTRMIGALGNADGPPEAHFGLGDTAPPYIISVRWSDGAEVLVEHDRGGRVVVTP